MAQDAAIGMREIARFNRLFDRKRAIQDELKARRGDQRRALLTLFDHPNAQVRLNAAEALTELGRAGGGCASAAVSRMFRHRLQNRARTSVLPQVEALSGEREAAWARVAAVDFLTVNEKRAAVGYGPVARGRVGRTRVGRAPCRCHFPVGAGAAKHDPGAAG